MKKFNLGDTVKVKAGVQDSDFDLALGGWQGRIVAIHEEESLKVAWDSITLRALPPFWIKQSEEEGYGWQTYYLPPEDLELAPARDTEEDVAAALAELQAMYAWDWIGPEGELIGEVLRGVDPEDDYRKIEAWAAYMQKQLTFPFDALVAEYQERGPLQSGDRVRVHGITNADASYGIIVNLHKGHKNYAFPLCDLKAQDEISENHDNIAAYRLWFANR